MEVKVTSMQGTHIFRRDQMTQLIRCIPWTTKLSPHLNIIKKMRTFLEVENKMGPIIPALASQFRPPLPEMNPNVRKSDATEKRKRVIPKKRFRPATPRATVMHLPLLQAPPKPTTDAAAASGPAMVREDTPWPSAGKMSGNLFEERNWLLPKGYLATEGEKEEMARPYPKEEGKMGEQNPKEEKCDWGPDCPFCKAQKKEAHLSHQQEQMEGQQQRPLPKLQAKRPNTLNMTKTKQQWEQQMERLNAKYNLDHFSDSELDSESDEDDQYQNQHGYETLI